MWLPMADPEYEGPVFEDTTAPLAKDNIQRPPHYARYAIEPISFIMLNNLPFYAGNVVKYVCRAPFKHATEEEDLRKAMRYIEMRLEQLKREREDDTAVVGHPL